MGIFIVSKSWFPKMTRPFKTPTHSQTVMNELVLPNDTNTLNNLMGGRLLHWMDICAAIAAQKHANPPDLIPHCLRLELMESELSSQINPRLHHFLESKSYRKAHDFLTALSTSPLANPKNPAQSCAR
jgi:hypothetical protein